MRRLFLAAFPSSLVALLIPAAVDVENIAPEDLWEEVRPVSVGGIGNIGGEHHQGPVQYQSFVQSLAEQVTRRSGNITNETKALLRAIRTAIAEEEGKADVHHDDQQRQLNKAANEVRQCNVWFNTYNSTEVAEARRVQAEARQNHSTCRGQEEIYYNASARAWGSVKQVADGFMLNDEPSVVEPSPSYPVPHGETKPPGINQGSCVSFENWLSSSKAKIVAAESSLAVAKAAYNSSYETYKAKQEECEADLMEFDEATCRLGEITCIHCESYKTCYLVRNATYWAEVEEARSSEAERKDEHVTMQYIKCLLEVLLGPLPNSTAIQDCVQESHDASHLNITYPGVDAQLGCMKLESAEMPCSTEYQDQQEYALWSSHSYECTNCANAGACTQVTNFSTSTTSMPTTSTPTTTMPTTTMPPMPTAHPMIENQENGCFIFAAGWFHVIYGNSDNGQLVCDGQPMGQECDIGSLLLADVKQVAAGAEATYILLNDNRILAFGRNDQNSGLGITALGGTDAPPITDILSGGYGACVRFQDLSMRCSGYGGMTMAAQIHNTFTGRNLKHWAGGRFHACAIMSDDTVLCSPISLDLGASYVSMDPPGDILDHQGGQVEQLCSATSFSCAIRKGDRKVVCWAPTGLYDRSSVTSTPPTLGAVHLTCAYSSACAFYDDGTNQCWGSGSNGQHNIPAEVAYNSDARFISSSGDQLFDCAAVPLPPPNGNGQVYCWGYWNGNTFQQFNFGVVGRSAAQCGSMAYGYDG